MKSYVALTSALVVGCLSGALPAHAVDLPAVKASEGNKVAACATPGRLMAFTKARNEKLDARFDGIATEYMRHGEELGMRWDIAYFQMLVETGSLKFGGDVKPAQNNFAGLGATGNGERGETFKDVTTGVRAHLEHLIMYTGEKVANPVAERTRKVQEWGVLTEWQKSFKGPLTFAQLAKKWAPPARKYAADIEQVAESFMDGACKSADPHPELVASARGGKPDAAADKNSKAVASADQTEKVSGAELAKRSVDEQRADGTGKKSALGAGSKAADAKPADAAKPQTFALINPPKPEPDAPAAQPKNADNPPATKVAAPAIAKGAKAAPAAAAGACKVFTASYGGAKAIIIKADTGEGTLYTVLDVNEGAETREADAYIAAYAPGGKQVGEFKSPNAALDKAFELCPEG